MKPNELREALKELDLSGIVHYSTSTSLHDSYRLREPDIDAILDAVMASLPKGGQVPADIRNRKDYSAIYKNAWSDHDKLVFELLQSAKSNQVMEIATSPEVIEGAMQKRIDLLDRAKSNSKESE